MADDKKKLITNLDILELKDVTSLPDELADWIFCNYKPVGEHTTTPMTPEMQKLKWETACRKGNDWKYGRFKICRIEMLWRKLTMSEFYGGSTVD